MLNKDLFRRAALLIAEKLREIATRQGNVPFDKGDLRKSHVVQPDGETGAILSANTPYARAVHDGRPALTIRPKRTEPVARQVTRTTKTGRRVSYVARFHPALSWPGAKHPVRRVRQPARKGKPWLRDSITTLNNEGLGFLRPMVGDAVADELTKSLAGNPHVKVRQR